MCPRCFDEALNMNIFFDRKSDNMLLDLIRSGFSAEYLIPILLMIPVFLFSLSVHESAHAIASNALGDPTAKNLGRITLNPAKHFDLYGFLAMLLFGFGWAKPVPVNTRHMKDGRWGFVWTSLAGPFSNILLAFLFAIIRLPVYAVLANMYVDGSVTSDIIRVLTSFFEIAVWLNVSLAVFNMLPIPPLDGSRLLTACLPRKWALLSFQYEHIIMGVLFVLLYMGAFTGILGGAKEAVSDFVKNVVGLIPIDGLLEGESLFWFEKFCQGYYPAA